MSLHTALRYLTFSCYAGMQDHPGFLSRSVARGDLLQAFDPFSDEAAQAFLRSEVLELSPSTNVRFAQWVDVERGMGP